MNLINSKAPKYRPCKICGAPCGADNYLNKETCCSMCRAGLQHEYDKGVEL